MREAISIATILKYRLFFRVMDLEYNMIFLLRRKHRLFAAEGYC